MSDSARSRLRGHLRQGKAWYRIEAKAESSRAEVYIYEEIGMWGITAQDFVRDLQGITASQIDLHLSTPGGEVFDGIAILECLRAHPATVTTYVDSLAASIGSVIAMAGDRIVMARNATMMIHDGFGLCVGNAADMRQMADLLDKTSDNIASVYAERAGGSVEQWRAAMRAETWYSAEEAVSAGLADEVTPAPGKDQENAWDLSIFGYAGRDHAPPPAMPSTPTRDVAEEATPSFDPETFRSAVRKAVA